MGISDRDRMLWLRDVEERDRLRDRIAELEKQRDELVALANLWHVQQAEYHNNTEGRAAAAAVRCCANELLSRLAPPRSDKEQKP